MDKIIISGAHFNATHGVLDFEKITPQPFVVDAVLYLDLSKAMKSDELCDTLNYARAYEIIEKAVTENTFNLIERLAGEIIYNLFKEFEQVYIINVKVSKPNAPINGDFNTVAVEFERRREDV